MVPSLFLPLVAILAVAFAVLIVAALAKVRTLLRPAGWMGEQRFKRRVCQRLPANEYRFLQDVLLPVEGGTTQIDFVIVSEFGIWIVETKDYQGWIFGSEKDRRWTQVLARHRGGRGMRTSFQNPLHQNYGHVKAFCAATGVAETQCHNLIVFTGTAEFKTERISNVLHLGEALEFIQTDRSNRFTKSEIEDIFTRIEAVRIPSTPESTKRHIHSLALRKNIPDSRFGASAQSEENRSQSDGVPNVEKSGTVESVRGTSVSAVSEDPHFVRCHHCRCIFPRIDLCDGRGGITPDGDCLCVDCAASIETKLKTPAHRQNLPLWTLGTVGLLMVGLVGNFVFESFGKDSSRTASNQNTPVQRIQNVNRPVSRIDSPRPKPASPFPSQDQLQRFVDNLTIKGWVISSGRSVILIEDQSYEVEDRLKIPLLERSGYDLNADIHDIADGVLTLRLESQVHGVKVYRVRFSARK